MSTLRTLEKGWAFTQVGGEKATKEGEWLPTQQFPTTVHVELLKLGKIPDPVRPIFVMPRNEDAHVVSAWKFIGLNEWDVQCTLRSICAPRLEA